MHTAQDIRPDAQSSLPHSRDQAYFDTPSMRTGGDFAPVKRGSPIRPSESPGEDLVPKVGWQRVDGEVERTD